jgi:hypothetical protein
MSSTPNFSLGTREQLKRLLGFLRPAEGDPTYLVLKAHLLAEEVLYLYVEGRAHRSGPISAARLSFSQLLALCRAFHPYSSEDWWAWSALQKLNSFRNTLAHNLEPKDLQDRIVEFSLFVADSIGATKDSEIGIEYERLAKGGTHPFVLALVALHTALCATLGFNSEKRWAALQ